MRSASRLRTRWWLCTRGRGSRKKIFAIMKRKIEKSMVAMVTWMWWWTVAECGACHTPPQRGGLPGWCGSCRTPPWSYYIDVQLLYGTVLHCAVLHCTVLYYTAPADIVDDVLLLLVGPGPGSGAQLVVHRADDVQLVVLPRQVTCKYLFSNAPKISLKMPMFMTYCFMTLKLACNELEEKHKNVTCFIIL